MLSVREAIRKSAKKFEDKSGFVHLVRTNKDSFELSFNLEDEIEFLLTGLGLEHKVELIEAFQDFSAVYYVLCVSYVNEGMLETYNIPISA